MGELVIIAGSLGQKASQGGFAWVLLQYLVGFRQVGWDVLFLDRLEPEMCADEAGREGTTDESVNVPYLRPVMDGFELGDAFAVLWEPGNGTVGLPRHEIVDRARRSTLLLNVMGYLDDEEILTAGPKRVFLDIDPGFGQMWKELGLADVFAGHDAYVTIGENIGRNDCSIPTCGLDWITTPQPVVLDAWPTKTADGRRFTSVASWRGAYGPIDYNGKTYGLRVHEFRKFFELPRLTGRPFELALDIHPADEKDRAALEANGWSLVDPRAVAGDPWTYREYVQGSMAEFGVAKSMYVQTRSGWFSDRSICYLASGKPVLVQDTGLKNLYPTGEGLLVFSTLEEAASGVEEICGNYERHARAAREIAKEYFDSDKVLTRLLEKLGVG